MMRAETSVAGNPPRRRHRPAYLSPSVPRPQQLLATPPPLKRQPSQRQLKHQQDHPQCHNITPSQTSQQTLKLDPVYLEDCTSSTSFSNSSRSFSDGDMVSMGLDPIPTTIFTFDARRLTRGSCNSTYSSDASNHTSWRGRMIACWNACIDILLLIYVVILGMFWYDVEVKVVPVGSSSDYYPVRGGKTMSGGNRIFIQKLEFPSPPNSNERQPSESQSQHFYDV